MVHLHTVTTPARPDDTVTGLARTAATLTPLGAT